VVVSTKKSTAVAGRPVTPGELAAGLEESLERLGVERVDIYHLHGVSPDHYRYARENLVPAMLKLKSQGKIGFLGITEAFESDRGHRTLAEAVKDDCWDVIMVGFNILNQSARTRVLPGAAIIKCGVLAMFAVRKVLGKADLLRETVHRMREEGKLGAGLPEGDDLPGFLVGAGGAESPADAAYRFCRDEPGIHCVLSGTGNPDHVAANAASLLRPPLPPAVTEALRTAFAAVDDVSGG
jgi:aryl-alcohol dehydrogenase-like predicted oxidoreductase